MADRSSLKLVGFIFATVTLAVMLTTAMVVKGYADGAYSLEDTSFVQPISHAFANHGSRICAPDRRQESAAPDQRQNHHRTPAAVRRTGS